MSEIRKIRIKTSRQKSPDPYRTYMLLHILLGFPLTALMGAVLADIIVWLQSGRYQGLVFWLPFVVGLMFILWLPVSVICGFFDGQYRP